MRINGNYDYQRAAGLLAYAWARNKSGSPGSKSVREDYADFHAV
ncbi:MAG TPA: hypothetical protein VGH51_12135 [Candidatus Angelobacter sp.]